jgi:hypothetical protein
MVCVLVALVVLASAEAAPTWLNPVRVGPSSAGVCAVDIGGYQCDPDGKKTLRAGQTFEVRITQPKRIGRVTRYRLRSGKVLRRGSLASPRGSASRVAAEWDPSLGRMFSPRRRRQRLGSQRRQYGLG